MTYGLLLARFPFLYHNIFCFSRICSAVIFQHLYISHANVENHEIYRFGVVRSSKSVLRMRPVAPQIRNEP
jgi:hypothetical protein